MTATMSDIELPGTPKPWMNTAVRWMLHVPGVRNLLGRMFAVITVTGAMTGRRYTTPIQYVRDGERYVFLSQRHRRWWTNLRRRPDVQLLVAGRTIHGTARVDEGDDAHEPIANVLRANPRIAKFYGVELVADGTPDLTGVAALAEKVVAITITPN